MDEQAQGPVEELQLPPVASVHRRAPRALWAALAAVALAAGGLVVSSAGDGGDQRPGLPVDLASATRQGGGEAAAADSMLAWVEYLPGGDLPALGGEATAYRLSGDVDEAQVRELAAALGLEGEVQQDGSSWSVTGEGGLGRLDVYAGGGAHWSWFAAYQDCVDADGSIAGCGSERCVTKGDVTECTIEATGTAIGSAGQPECEGSADCAMPTTTSVPPCAPDGACASEPAPACPAPLPGEEAHPCPPDHVEHSVECPGALDPTSPTAECPDTGPAPDLPAEEDARQVALDVVAATGADVADARVESFAAGNVWSITVELVLDGVPSGLHTSVEVGPDLRVLSGIGVFGQVESLGDYPVLDTRATIERANAQRGSFSGIEPALGQAEDASGTSGSADTAGGDTGATDPGATDDGASTTTVVTQCAAVEGGAGDCGGTTGCGDDGCVEPPTTVQCKVQADGSETCELTQCFSGTADDGAEPAIDLQPCDPPTCPQTLPPTEEGSNDEPVAAPDAAACTPPPSTIPVPDPEPVQIVLVDAERSLVLLPANDGSADAYLVPAYRFTVEDGGRVDLPAVADEALAGPPPTETTVPDTVVPEPVPVPEPQPCEVLEEQDPASATTHTVQTCPTPGEDPGTLGDGEEPAIGVRYHVDIDFSCPGFLLGDTVWAPVDRDEVAAWERPGEPFEGGTFTLDSADHGTFVGDAAGTKVADFRTLGATEDMGCSPQRR